MAGREMVRVIRSAFRGDAKAQMVLGRRYLTGGAGLPRSLETALLWLDRAAQQDEPDAWMLIGARIPFEVADRHAPSAELPRLRSWYERAFDAGVVEAGFAFARFVLARDRSENPALHGKAMLALRRAAEAGIADAQWLLAQRGGKIEPRNAFSRAPRPQPVPRPNHVSAASTALEWAARAADNGVLEARYALADQAWFRGDFETFLQWSLPIARELIGHRPARFG